MRFHSTSRPTNFFANLLIVGVAVMGFACAPSQTPEATPTSSSGSPISSSPSSTQAEVIPGQWKLVSFGAPW